MSSPSTDDNPKEKKGRQRKQSFSSVKLIWLTTIGLLACLTGTWNKAPQLQLLSPSSSPSSSTSSSSSSIPSSTTTVMTIDLPPFSPRLDEATMTLPRRVNGIGHQEAQAALRDFFANYTSLSRTGGWMDLSGHLKEDGAHHVERLRALARAMMMQRDLDCGRPRTDDKQDSEDYQYEYCFWKDDLVSGQAMNDFWFERPLWQWVAKHFNRFFSSNTTMLTESDKKRLGNFLDLGVNVADWASPILYMAASNYSNNKGFGYFGVEGSPPTAALAAANMLTSLLNHQQQPPQQQSSSNHRHDHTVEMRSVPSAYLFPFPLLSWQLYEKAQREGGVCFSSDQGNVGGQGIKSSNGKSGSAATLQCSPHLAAGGAYFPQALQAITRLQQGLLPFSNTNPWPSFFIAKLDIQNFEFKALSSALEWLQRKPPCYIVIEAYPPNTQMSPHMWALWEILLDAGYDAIWRAYDMYHKKVAGEFPPDEPYWKAGTSNGTSMSLYEAWEKDLQSRMPWSYKDYIIGFHDEAACVERHLAAS